MADTPKPPDEPAAPAEIAASTARTPGTPGTGTGTSDEPDAIGVSDDAPVPKLPRGGSFKLSMPQLMRIGVTAAILVLVVMMRQPCSSSVSKFVTDFGSGSSTAMPKPENVDKGVGGEMLGPGMTEQQIKDAIERERARARGESGGSASGGSAGSGSAGSAGSAGSGSAGNTGSGSAGNTGSGSAGNTRSGSAGTASGSNAR